MKESGVENKPILTLEAICKNFGGVVAADNVSFGLIPGEVFGLIGPNGAGKSTIINLITGIYNVDSGKVILDGQDITKAPCHTRVHKGISRSFQHPQLLQRSDIRTNIYLGMDLARKKPNSGMLNHMEFLDFLLETAKLNLNMDGGIDKLSYGQRKLLEIVRALLTRPKVLLLDEPAAGLNQKELEQIEALIKVALDMNSAVLFIEHRMDLVMSICHRITVLNFGHQIASGYPNEIQNNPLVIEAYLGRGRECL